MLQTGDLKAHFRTADRYLKPNQRFLCVEGGIDQDVYDYFGQASADEQQQEDGITTYMYAGILEPVTGKPIISTRFPGWEKYNEYIAFCGVIR